MRRPSLLAQMLEQVVEGGLAVEHRVVRRLHEKHRDVLVGVLAGDLVDEVLEVRADHDGVDVVDVVGDLRLAAGGDGHVKTALLGGLADVDGHEAGYLHVYRHFSR